MNLSSRRQFLRDLGLGAAVLPLVSGLPGLRADPAPARRQRLILCFTPNGVVPEEFWPCLLYTSPSPRD